MPEDPRPDGFLQPIDLPEAQCIIGDVYRTLIAYQEWVAKNGFSHPHWVQRFLNRLLLANHDMRAWAMEHGQREEIGLDPDLAQLVDGIREAADEIHRTIAPFLVRALPTFEMSNGGGVPTATEENLIQFPSGTAPLLADTLSCLALRTEAPVPSLAHDSEGLSGQ
jgi:hypothetical protein